MIHITYAQWTHKIIIINIFRWCLLVYYIWNVLSVFGMPLTQSTMNYCFKLQSSAEQKEKLNRSFGIALHVASVWRLSFEWYNLLWFFFHSEVHSKLRWLHFFKEKNVQCAFSVNAHNIIEHIVQGNFIQKPMKVSVQWIAAASTCNRV